MGMRYGESRRRRTRHAPAGARAVQAAEAAALAVAGVLTAVDSAAGRSSQSSNAIGLPLLERPSWPPAWP